MNKINVLTDVPLISTSRDALNFKKYSLRLADIIMGSDPRFAVGIFGSWGTGKTSLMKMIEAELNGYIFNWEDILSNDRDKAKFERYIKENFDNTNWIRNENIVKSQDGKSIYIKNDTKSLSISFDEITNSVSISINGEQNNSNLVMKKENGRLNIYKNENNILTVWFEAWRYDRDSHFALLPFLRQLRIKLENQPGKSEWSIIKKGVEHTLNALADSIEPAAGYSSYFTLKLNIRAFMSSLKSTGSTSINGENILLQEHPTDHLANAIKKLRKKNDKIRIVVFIDDLDRCAPDKALEVLESIKAFLDIEGMVYVIAMDSNSIDAIVKKKYGDNPAISGRDYLQKIVQLPFQIPTWKDGWKEEDIENSIKNILSTELQDYGPVSEIVKNLKLIISGVQLNPREVKRFINNVILAHSVFSQNNSLSITNLIAVQALFFRNNWKEFSDIIASDKNRNDLLIHYKEFKAKEKVGEITVPPLEQLIPNRSAEGTTFFVKIKEIYDELLNRKEIKSNFLNDIENFYVEYVKQGKDLRKFLESGAGTILMAIKEISEYRIALAATKDEKTEDRINADQLELVPEIRRREDKDKEFPDRQMYQVNVTIDAPIAILNKIEYVNYRLPPIWGDRAFQKIENRSTQFKLKDLAWGDFTLFADVKFKEQDQGVTLSRKIVLRE